MTALAALSAAGVVFLLARFTPMRAHVALLLLAVLFLPMSLTLPGFNGLSLLGTIAAIASIALAMFGAPSNKAGA